MLLSTPSGDVLDTVKLSRQDALLGNYSSSLSHFDDVLDKINQSVQTWHTRPAAYLPVDLTVAADSLTPHFTLLTVLH